jgi:uncharacterized membrane protein YeaQ/YmgE (transglycosylase-associated protein family)
VHITLAVIIWTIIIGLIIGGLGRLVVPGKQNMGLGLTLVAGVVAGAQCVGRSRYLPSRSVQFG